MSPPDSVARAVVAEFAHYRLTADGNKFLDGDEIAVAVTHIPIT